MTIEFASLAALGVGALVLDRLLLRAEERGWIYYRRRKASPGSAASAYLEVQKVFEPEKRYVLEAHRREDVEEDGEGAPPRPGPGK